MFCHRAVRSFFSIFFATILAISSSYAGDWPQIHGPDRNGRAKREKLSSNWNQPPVKQWTAEVGEGYAGPAVVGAQLYIFHRTGDTDTLDCLATNDGSKTWSVNWPAGYKGGIDSDTGPRCVPLARDGNVYVLSAAGTLHSATVSGKKNWSRNLAREYGGQEGYFGFGSTPLLIGDTLLVNVGGKKGASVVAVDSTTGKLRWKQFDDGASYAAPIEWKLNGQPCAVFITRLNLLGLRPDTGNVIFQMPFGARGPTVNAAAPLVLTSDRLFLTASYRIGAKVVSIDSANSPVKPAVVWESDDSLSSQYPTPIYDDGFLYGVHGREDGPAAALRCVDAKDGKVKWSQNGVGMAHLIAADGKILMQTIDGELALLEMTPQSYQELGRIRISNATSRALPALSNGRFYTRDTNGKLTAWQLP